MAITFSLLPFLYFAKMALEYWSITSPVEMEKTFQRLLKVVVPGFSIMTGLLFFFDPTPSTFLNYLFTIILLVSMVGAKNKVKSNEKLEDLPEAPLGLLWFYLAWQSWAVYLIFYFWLMKNWILLGVLIAFVVGQSFLFLGKAGENNSKRRVTIVTGLGILSLAIGAIVLKISLDIIGDSFEERYFSIGLAFFVVLLWISENFIANWYSKIDAVLQALLWLIGILTMFTFLMNSLFQWIGLGVFNVVEEILVLLTKLFIDGAIIFSISKELSKPFLEVQSSN